MLTLLGTNVATVQSVSDEAKYASSALTPPIAGDDTSFVKRHLRSMLTSDPATTNIEERVAVPKFLDLPSNVLSEGLTSVKHGLAKFQRWLVKILKRVSLKRQNDEVSLKRQNDEVSLKRQNDEVSLKRQNDEVSLKRQNDEVSLKEKIFGEQDLNQLSNKDVFEEVITKVKDLGLEPKAYKLMAQEKGFESDEALINVQALEEAVGYERAVKVLQTMVQTSEPDGMAMRMYYLVPNRNNFLSQESKDVAQIP
ncbi:unnamed protein product [Peronospora belbahrii]|uniref:Uncharacterized protein n=1 Tax=Peronospora belbahrii TaxID=622444 RepID=A0ABN8D260_9STRA|nr:unnamed protein product [Peronospora belbahrii]